MEQNLANTLADSRSTRLTRDQVWNRPLLEVFRQETNLSGLSAALDAFKTDESALCHFGFASWALSGTERPAAAGYCNRISAQAIACFVASTRSNRLSVAPIAVSFVSFSGCLG